MRIVVWNAHQALYRKQYALNRLRPDIAVIPECADDIEAPEGCFVWVGKNHSKGLGVLSYGEYRLTRLAYDPRVKWAIPISVTGPHVFFLLALWNMPPYDQDVKAIDRYHRMLVSRPAVVAGDFNVNPNIQRQSGAEWEWIDSTRQRDPRFFLEDTPSVSAYHKYTHEAPGAETRATHYWLYKRQGRIRYHFDYCFIPESWRLGSVRVGTFDAWVRTRLSDHVPLIVDVYPTARWQSDARLAA
jgi:exodeoxyribonuclease III